MEWSYERKAMLEVLEEMLQQTTTATQHEWLMNQAKNLNEQFSPSAFYLAFAALPRFVGKKFFSPDIETAHLLQQIRRNFRMEGWTLDRMARVYLLLQVPAADRGAYVQTIEQLFRTAEMNEQVALYAALPLLAYPEAWKLRCAEGIRSNIGGVLEAIMCNNPYPSENLDEPAWNQLVLKAFFTEKPVHQIIGLDGRANYTLAHVLSDYAHERWAAGRPVNPQLWRPIAKFIDEKIFPDIERVFQSENNAERTAAALACAQSNYAPAKALLEKDPVLKNAIEKGTLNWDVLAFQQVLA